MLSFQKPILDACLICLPKPPKNHSCFKLKCPARQNQALRQGLKPVARKGGGGWAPSGEEATSGATAAPYRAGLGNLTTGESGIRRPPKKLREKAAK